MRYFTSMKEELFFKQPNYFDKYKDLEYLKYGLGANLYMNGLKDFYNKIINGDLEEVTSISICFEDATKESELEVCEENVLSMLEKLHKHISSNDIDYNIPLIFIRVRNYEQFVSFTERVSKNQISNIAGFIFPKFTSQNGHAYLDHVNYLCKKFNDVFYAMPILESEEIIYKETRLEELIAVKKIIDEYKSIILNIRVGGTDFSSKFGLRRNVDYDIYDIKVVSDCLIDIVNMFLREGSEYVISAPVWEYFSNDINSKETQGLIREIKKDKENGFIGKTVIHPTQAKYVNAIYAVSYDDYMDALGILEFSEDGGVFKGYSGNKMNEVKPHLNWAKRILVRSEIYGVLKEGINNEDLLKEKVVIV